MSNGGGQQGEQRLAKNPWNHLRLSPILTPKGHWTAVSEIQLFQDVLLIEDEPAHAQLITRALRGLVGEVHHAKSGADAMDKLVTILPELVLCDLYLGDTTGLVLLKELLRVRPGLPVIMMTSSLKIDDAVTAMRDGAWDYLVKQLTDDFHSRLQLVLARAANRRDRSVKELQLRAERDAFWRVVRSAQDGVAVTTADGTVVFANDAFADFAGIAGVDSSNLDSSNLPAIVERWDKAVAASLRLQLEKSEGRFIWRSEFKVSITDHPERVYELVINASDEGVADEGPLKLRRFVVWVRDVTTRKEQERFQRDLLATTTHDLKGPLGAIITSTELLSAHMPVENPRLGDLVTRIGACARNCVTLIDELLSARRIQDGVLVVRPRWLELPEMVEEINLDYQTIARAKNITLTVDPTSDATRIFADKLAFSRVVGNLLSNAIKFTPNGGAVSVAYRRVDQGVLVIIEDTGSGIEPEECHKLFEKFMRLDKHQEVHGTGLGLFVVKSIVDAHNGRIDVQSQVGKGTRFELLFPDGVEAPKVLEVG